MPNSEAATTKATEVAGDALSLVVRNGILGALLLLAVLGIIWLLYRTVATQDSRIEDQKKANEQLEKTRERTYMLSEQLLKTMSDFQASLERLVEADEDTRKDLAELQSNVYAMQTTIDSVLREAVKRTPHVGIPQYRRQYDEGDRTR